MLIKVKVFPGAAESKIVKKKKDEFDVHVKQEARENKANKAVCRIFSSYFQVGKNKVRIVKGGKTSSKIIRIMGGQG